MIWAAFVKFLRRERPDIAALQEVDCRMWRTAYDDQSEELASALSTNAYFCATRPIEHGSFAMAILSSFSIVRRRTQDCSN